MTLSLEKIEKVNLYPIINESFNHLASFIELIPTGPFSVNSIDNQVISSNNLATARSLKTSISMILVFRSLTDESMNLMLEKTKLAARISASDFIENLLIPKWKNSNTELTDVFKRSYNNLYGKELSVIKTQYSLDSSMIFNDMNVKIVSIGVKYKVDNKQFYTKISDIGKVATLIEEVLANLENNKE